MHKQPSMRFVVTPLEEGRAGVARAKATGVARGYHGGVLLYLTTLMELVSVARSNTLTSSTHTPDRQSHPSPYKRRNGAGMPWKKKKNHVGRMRRPFVVRHRVMCARSMARVRMHGERQGTKKNSGVSVVRGRKRERGGKRRVEREPSLKKVWMDV